MGCKKIKAGNPYRYLFDLCQNIVPHKAMLFYYDKRSKICLVFPGLEDLPIPPIPKIFWTTMFGKNHHFGLLMFTAQSVIGTNPHPLWFNERTPSHPIAVAGADLQFHGQRWRQRRLLPAARTPKKKKTSQNHKWLVNPRTNWRI